MKNGLLIAAKMPGHDPEDILHVRAFAITICEPSMTEFSYNALRVVNSFLRRSDRRNQTEINDYKVVSRVYRDTISFLDENGLSAEDWTNEDVSTLIDHVISVSAKCKSFDISNMVTISNRSIRRLLKLRSDALKRIKSPACEKLSHAFQEQLWATQGYELLASDETDEAIQVAASAAMKTFPSNLLPNDEADSVTGDATLFCSKSALRILRILEPFRKQICQSASPPTNEGVILLQMYMIVYEKGLQDSKCKCSKSKNARYTGPEIVSRIEKMIGSVVEAAEKLISKCLVDDEAERLAQHVKNISTLLEYKKHADYAWEL
eukprot:IDg12976t1